MQIGSQYQKEITTQNYQQKPTIQGVEIKQLAFHNDDGGNFSELFRLTEGKVEGFEVPFEVRQVSMSVLTPQTIKAFHIHYQQEDLWYVPPYDRLLANFIDIREDSPTYQNKMRLVLGGGKSLLVRIPAGVAHGVANIYQRSMTLFYATSAQFNPQQPDEHRLPWDTFGRDLWELTKG
ncbi:dTDP-4-dehydrorhamnose 3,5-epimerase family protein [Patescibacteria group bacterium]|nr:dTDP-4-dehydrorhamnose 3,5-epimerase family protein [Patescibacteria group bacterium]